MLSATACQRQAEGSAEGEIKMRQRVWAGLAVAMSGRQEVSAFRAGALPMGHAIQQNEAYSG